MTRHSKPDRAYTTSVGANGAGVFAACKPCDWERWFATDQAAAIAVTDHNKTKHKDT